MKSYEWNPFFRCRGSLRLGLKLIKRRHTCVAQGEWNEATAGGGLEMVMMQASTLIGILKSYLANAKGKERNSLHVG